MKVYRSEADKVKADDLEDKASAILDWFEKQDWDQVTAVAAMGMAITAIFSSNYRNEAPQEAAKMFSKVLREAVDITLPHARHLDN